MSELGVGQQKSRWSRRLAWWIGMLGWASCRAANPTAAPGDEAQQTSPANAPEPAVPSEAEVLANSHLPRLVPKPLANDPMAVTVHRLSNGMTVYISENHEKPKVSAWIGVRVGGRMDPATSTGLAHYLEHMLFKGSDEFGTIDARAEAEAVQRVRELYRQLRNAQDEAERNALLAKIDQATQTMAEFAIPNELDRMYSALGVTGVNAFTSFESTVYIGNVPSNRLAAWSRVESERFSDPVFRLFLPELEAVYEEKNLSLDNPERRVLQAGLEKLFPQHPYGTQTILGEIEHLKNPAYEDMESFFEQWYVPNNMAIALAGDVDPKAVIPLLEGAFGRLEPRALPTAAPGSIVPLQERVAVDVLAPGTQSVSVSWLAPAMGHPDEVAMSVLDRLMHDRSFGLLELELHLTQKVPDVGCWYWALNEAGVFTIVAQAKQGQSLDEVEALIRAAVQTLAEGGFEDVDLEAAKLQEHIDKLKALEGNEGRVSKMMDAFTDHLEWPEMVERDRKYRAVTRQDVVRVAKAYLGPASVVVRRIEGQPEVPKLAKPAITPIPIDAARQSTFAKAVEDMPAEELTPQWLVEGTHYVHRDLAAGPLIAVPNPRNELFSMTYEFKRGYSKAPLLCFALELLAVSGAGELSATALQRKLYQLGTTIDTSCDAEFSRIRIAGVDRNFEESLALLETWLAKPAFDGDAIEKLLDSVLTRRKSLLEEDRPLTQALEAFAQYGDASAWLKHPSNRTLQKAKAAQLSALLRGVMGVMRRTLYFGPRAPDEVARLLDVRGRYKDPGETWVRQYVRHETPTVLFLHKDGAKANVRLVLPQPPLPAPQRPVAKLFREYLSGSMASLIFQEIRESRGLAYSASAYYAEPSVPRDETALVGLLSTQADKTPEASNALLEVLRRSQIAESRLAHTKLALDQEYRSTRIDPRSIMWWVAAWDDMGEPKDPRPEEWQAILGTSVEIVEAFATDVARVTPTIAVIGDRSRVDLDALGKLGHVVEVQPSQLFSFGSFERSDPSSATRR